MKTNMIMFCLSIACCGMLVNVSAMNDFNDLPQYEANLARGYVAMANQGDADSQYKIGILYADTQTNPAGAISWLKLAANQGHVLAQETLGYLYEHGQGVDANREMAIRWYRMAAEQGHEGAKYALEHML